MLFKVHRVFALSFHADYRCAHSGVCCSSHWDVPVELPIYRRLSDALAAGVIRQQAPADGGGAPFMDAEEPADEAAAIFARTPEGRCVFFHGESRLCSIHRDAGEGHLPSTCRHFPRVAVRDRRGTFISLTHFCPTAAKSLFRTDVPIEVVESPPPFPPTDYEGLSVGDEDWPPLLHPTMLADLDGYSAWERHMVSRCADPTLDAETVVATLERDARALHGFVPGALPLARLVAELPVEPVRAYPDATLAPSLAHYAAVIATVPDEFKPDPDECGLEGAFSRLVAPAWADWQLPLKRYLAAKAFANWTAYQGRGFLTIVRGLEAALALVRVEAARQCRNTARPLDAALLLEAFRQADFALNHLAVGEDLATQWSNVEEWPRATARRRSR
jgi:Fe-S-cluster containining protein